MAASAYSNLTLGIAAAAALAANRAVTAAGAYPADATNAVGFTQTAAALGDRVPVTAGGTAIATASAATPDDTPVCSATLTAPLPKVSSKMPILAAAFHCTQVGAGTPRQRRKPYITAPAAKKRIPPSISGGQYSTPIRITR